MREDHPLLAPDQQAPAPVVAALSLAALLLVGAALAWGAAESGEAGAAPAPPAQTQARSSTLT